MNAWVLPQSIEIGGTSYAINADFRDILDILSRMNNPEEEESTRVYVALSLFYEEFDTMPEADWDEAMQRMHEFISLGEEDDGQRRPKEIDWEQDRLLIISDINDVAGCEIRNLEFCHWWTFMAWFNAIGEGQLSMVVSIRNKLRKHKKLEGWEREYYRLNRSKVDFKTKYTSAENETLSKWLGAK